MPHRKRKPYLERAVAPGPLCPTPFKRVYATFKLANDWIASFHADDTSIRPYTCPCGAIHIGHRAQSRRPV